MKRWVLIILVFLVLGAVVNVTVAWSIALGFNDSWLACDWTDEAELLSGSSKRTFLRRYSVEFLIPMDDREWELVFTSKRFGANAHSIWFGKRGKEWMRHGDWVDSWSFGLPMRSLTATKTRWVLSLADGTHPSMLPLRPVWSGFAINTVFYAFVLWLPLCSPFALQRYLRNRRGQCPKCGYPAGSSSTCTECGSAVPVRRQQA